ncbi:MAG: hypothetical protein GY755_04285 [Chloroflexi bacterium]|nr:hypothetical protein [Chloroflexota bacterium]
MENVNTTPQLEDIYASEGSDLEKLKSAFDAITKTILEQSAHELEVLRAMSEKDALVKEQIKKSTVKHVRYVFNHCYTKVTGKKAWDE